MPDAISFIRNNPVSDEMFPPAVSSFKIDMYIFVAFHHNFSYNRKKLLLWVSLFRV